MLNNAIKEFLKEVNKKNASLKTMGFKFNQLNTREMLAQMTRQFMTECDLSIITIDEVVYNLSYPVPIRIYIPKTPTDNEVSVFIHGGGHISGSLSVYDGIIRKLARTSNQIIIGIEYRLSPECPYPCALNDCKAVILGLKDLLFKYKVNYQKLNLVGDSAGGALCASLSSNNELVTIGLINKQVLIYPSLNYLGETESMQQFKEGYLLEKEKILFYIKNYFQANEDLKKVSPLYMDIKAAYPTSLIIAAQYDPLLSDAKLYAKKLEDSKINHQLMILDGMIHAFLMLENLCRDECNLVYEKINQFFKNN